MDDLFAKLDRNASRTARAARNGILGLGLVILIVAAVLTVAGIVLALTVSPWFWIAVVVTGAYTAFAGVWTLLASSITKDIL
jgi:uncharacterized membrane protein